MSAFAVMSLAMQSQAQAADVQFVILSDVHFGYTRSFTVTLPGTGATTNALLINQALLASLNQVSAMSVPSDGGVGAGGTVGAIDTVVVTGDMANRYENNSAASPAPSAANVVQIDATSWTQFSTTYLQGLTLKTKANATSSFFLSPGNHDISNAIGYYDILPNSNPTPGQDDTSLRGMMQVASGGSLLPANTYTEAYFTQKNVAGAWINKPNYSMTINGVHFISIAAWPDSGSRSWIDNDLLSVALTTPVIIFTHCYPDVDSALLTPNPNSVAYPNSKTYQCVVSDLVDASEVGSTGTSVEQLAFVRWIKTHPNIVAYFHGHTNFNEMYTYTGPEDDIALNCFRIDSPMKGQLSAASATSSNLLSFQLASLDLTHMLMTVREIRWFPTPAFSTDTSTLNPDTAVSNNKILSATNTPIMTVPLAVAAPTFGVPSGTYGSAQSVSLACSTANTAIYYTIDGSTPSLTSALYTAPVSVSATTTLRALAATTTFSSMAPSASSATYTIALTSPTLSLSRGVTAVAYGSTDTVTGSLVGAGSTLTYTLTNIGTASETLTGSPTIGNLTNCTVTMTSSPASSIAMSATTSLAVVVNPLAAGAWSFTVSIPDSDGSNNPYLWTVHGTAGAAPGSSLSVSRNSTAIAATSTDTVTGTVAATAKVLTYTLTNNGALSESILGSPTIAALSNCSATVTSAPPSSIAAPGGTGSLTLSVTPSAAGAWSLTVALADTDSTHNPYLWTISGSATAAPAPALSVSRGTSVIAPTSSDVASGSQIAVGSVLTYTLTNTGLAAETISGTPTISGQTNCLASLTTAPSASIAAAGTTTLVVEVIPAAAGAWSFSLSISDADTTSNPYAWTVTGSAPAASSSDDKRCGHGSGAGALIGMLFCVGFFLYRRKP